MTVTVASYTYIVARLDKCGLQEHKQALRSDATDGSVTMAYNAIDNADTLRNTVENTANVLLERMFPGSSSESKAEKDESIQKSVAGLFDSDALALWILACCQVPFFFQSWSHPLSGPTLGIMICYLLFWLYHTLVTNWIAALQLCYT